MRGAADNPSSENCVNSRSSRRPSSSMMKASYAEETSRISRTRNGMRSWNFRNHGSRKSGGDESGIGSQV